MERKLTNLSEALEAAHELLIAVGFQLTETSPSGSRYYHLSGRQGGMLRLSDHAFGRRPENLVAMLTIHAAHMPGSVYKLRMMVAEAIGWYLLNTVPMKGTNDESCL